jgi:hypothetical protein
MLSARFLMPEAEARQVMLARGLTPIDTYPGSGRPWRCVHECGREVTPTLSNVRVERGICRYCNSAFPYDGPAVVYLVADRAAVKIGCAARGSGRVAEHVRYGWAEAWQINTLTGDDAYAVEQAVITWWREPLDAPTHYAAEHMPQSGATETVAWDISPPAATLEMALAFARAASLTVEVSSMTSVGRNERPTTGASALGVRARRKAMARAATGAGPNPFF